MLTMNWIKKIQLVTRLPKVVSDVYTQRSPNHSLVNKQQYSVLADKIPLFKKSGLTNGNMDLERKLHWRSYGHAIHNGPNLSREFFVQLWIADGKLRMNSEKRNQVFSEHENRNGTNFGTKDLHGSYFSESSMTRDEFYDSKKLASEPLESTAAAAAHEAWIALLLSRSNLLITREIEWANLTLGFEQENKYAIVDVDNPQVPAGFIREESNVIMRQLLRTRRPFVATITDRNGNELFRVRRPFWWLTSSIFAEVGGKEIGVVHRRWHLWRRVYDLYLGDEQFAVVENPGFWNWTFTLKGINGEMLAEIDRDWRGFGFEVFTDAGQYVIRFGSAAANNNLSEKVQDFKVARPLTLSERAVTVALAVSLDNDYFSRHGGWGLPFFMVAE